jgi:3-hydroxyacyl-CoA dehydrogenase
MNEIDVLLDILKQMVGSHPASGFVNSLYEQYCNRGGLSKKQLEGLYAKAVKSGSIAHNKLATLEAIIKKKPTRERAAASAQNHTQPEKDLATGKILSDILDKYPQHKRVLFLKLKYDNNETLSPVETGEVQKFGKFLLK